MDDVPHLWDYLTISEAADVLVMKPDTIREMLDRGVLASLRIEDVKALGRRIEVADPEWFE